MMRSGGEAAAFDPGPAEESEHELARRGWEVILNESVESWPLPARVQNWCRSNRIATVAQLVLLSEVGLADQRNLGVKSLADMRLIIEFRFRAPWETVRRAMLGFRVQAGPQPGWDGLPDLVPDEVAKLPVGEFRLPKRLATYCTDQRVKTLGELITIPRSKLASNRNLGLTSLQRAEKTIRDVVANLDKQRASWSEGLLPSWEHALSQLPPNAREVILRRAGFDGPQETQQQIGDRLGVTCVRIRQIENKQLEILRRQGAWLDFVRARFAELLKRRGGAVAVRDLALERWWSGFESRPRPLDYLCKHLLDERYRVVDLDGDEYLTGVSVERFERAWHELRTSATQHPIPSSLARFQRLTRKAEKTVGPTLASVLWMRLEGLLQVDYRAGRSPRVVAMGTNRAVRALAMLRASKVPLPMEEITAKIGRFNPTEEMIYFDRGLIGLEEHFPDFKGWQQYVVPVALRVMRERSPDRVWTCAELLPEIREAIVIPDWIDHWPLASLLRRSGEFEYLGYLRFVLPKQRRD